MGGGLMQLVAYGAQDIYLTGNPQITFFKVVYRRHTNFSMEAIQQTFNGTVGQGESTVTATISRNGDLVGRLWLDALIDRDTAASGGNGYLNYTNNTGHALVKQCEVEIGGQMIDRHYSQWLDVWNELTDHDESEWIGLNKHKTKVAYLQSKTRVTADDITNTRLYVPLQFWFCRNPGLALPLIALQYHEVKVKITFEEVGNLAIENHDDDESDFAAGTQAKATAGAGNTFNLWCDYIYLDTDERRRFAQVSHEYLIEQVQYENKSGGSMDLNFNHPVKELIWAGIRGSVADHAGETNADDLYQRAKLSNAVTDTFQLKLNGHDRFKERDSRYFTRTQIWEHHTGYGDTQISAGTSSSSNIVTDTIAVYSFALKPEEHQPSGTCNFSRIDNAQLVQGGTSAVAVNVYAVNYNVLRIMSGMGGLAYSN
jgi:hypothetical protein